MRPHMGNRNSTVVDRSKIHVWWSKQLRMLKTCIKQFIRELIVFLVSRLSFKAALFISDFIIILSYIL